MWCDNCLLLFPLRHGALAWNLVILVYNAAGALVLFLYGQYLFFTYPEWEIYGGLGFAVAALCIVNVIALSNSSYMWTRVCFVVWPFILILVAVRAGVMLFQLNREQDKIIWECNNDRQLWPASVTSGYGNDKAMPSEICSAGYSSLYIAFALSLALDFALQLYAYFMCWRFMKRIEHYYALATSESKMYRE